MNKKYDTKLHEGHRPDLHPNGRILRSIEDKGNGYLIVTSNFSTSSNDKTIPNMWLINKKELYEI